MKQDASVVERHSQTVLQVVIAALILWVGATVSGTSTTVAVIARDLKHVTDDVEKIEERVNHLENESHQ